MMFDLLVLIEILIILFILNKSLFLVFVYSILFYFLLSYSIIINKRFKEFFNRLIQFIINKIINIPKFYDFILYNNFMFFFNKLTSLYHIYIYIQIIFIIYIYIIHNIFHRSFYYVLFFFIIILLLEKVILFFLQDIIRYLIKEISPQISSIDIEQTPEIITILENILSAANVEEEYLPTVSLSVNQFIDLYIKAEMFYYYVPQYSILPNYSFSKKYNEYMKKNTSFKEMRAVLVEIQKRLDVRINQVLNLSKIVKNLEIIKKDLQKLIFLLNLNYLLIILIFLLSILI